LTQHPNTAAAGVAGAVGVLVTYILTALGVDVPPTVGGAISTIIAALALFIPGPKRG
jgi:putative flippase GtrA